MTINERKKSFRWNRGEVTATIVASVTSVALTIVAMNMLSDPFTPEPPAEQVAASNVEVAPVPPAIGLTDSVSPSVESMDDLYDPLGRADIAYTVEQLPTPIIQTVEKEIFLDMIAPCKNEDGSDQNDPCIWDAKTMGNGQGMSFIVMNGEFYYLEGSGLNTHIEGDPFAMWPTGPVTEFDPGVLMCGTGAAPAEDTDPNGNHWAYCEPALVQ